MTLKPHRSKSFVLIRDHWSLVFGLCSLIMVGLILVAPLLQSTPLKTDDGALHIYRTVALDRSIQDGLLYPRWFPDLAYGYGFPFFNYREPLSYYAVEVLHLGGASFPLSLNLVLATSVIFSGLAMLLWVGDIFNQTAGWMAGLIYMASPYTLIGSLERANLPEVIALALLPLILFFFRRLIVIGGRKYFIASLLSYTALLLTHNISSLIFTPTLIVYLIVVRGAWPISTSSRVTRHTLRTAVIAIVLALSLTAFFWLPALAEGSYVQLNLTHSNHNNDYHYNFLSGSELLGGPEASDPNLINTPVHFALGWPEIVLALIGLNALRRTSSRDRRAHVMAAFIAALAFIFMTLPVSLPIWDHLPLIRFVQFPWRFVGRAALPISLLGGAAIYVVEAQLTRRLAFSLMLIGSSAVLLFAAPFLYPRTVRIKDNLNINDVFAFEHATGSVGVDPVGAYLPVTVQDRPGGSPLEARYTSGTAIRRFDRATLPDGAAIIDETYRPNYASIDLSGPIGFQATYLTFDFPGWRVSIDQQPVPIVASNPLGLITFNVPAGAHHLEVSFGSTPIRSLADLISLAALALCVVASIGPKFPSVPLSPQSSTLKLNPVIYLVIPAAFILIKSAFIDTQLLTPFRSTRLVNDQITGVDRPMQIDFGGQLRLLGYNLSATTVPSGEATRVDLYWRALTATDLDYQTTVGIIDARGEIWSPTSLDRPHDFRGYPPTPQLPTTAYVIDSFELPISPGTPPGTYTLFAEVFNTHTWVPLAAQADAPHPPQRPYDTVLASIAVTHALQIFSNNQLGIYNLKIDQAITPDLKLLGANRDRDDAGPGDAVLLTLFWQSIQKPTVNDALEINLVDAHNLIVNTNNFPVGNSTYPPSNWNNGEQIIDLDRVRVPIAIQTGAYHWQLSMANQPPIDLGPLRVTAPDRSFTPPAIRNRIDQTFDNKITLLGYQIEGAAVRGQALKVTVYWRAENEMDYSYKVFIHLLKPDGTIAAQIDAIPMNGTRPTISWQPGEIITDTHTLSLADYLPAGEYQLSAGLYDAGDLGRLKVASGEDQVDLTTINLAP